MKLLSLLLAISLSFTVLAQSKPSQKKLDYVANKTQKISVEMKDRFSDPEEPDMVSVALFVRESFLKDKLIISPEAISTCLQNVLNEEDYHFMSTYEVLRSGSATECLASKLHKK